MNAPVAVIIKHPIARMLEIGNVPVCLIGCFELNTAEIEPSEFCAPSSTYPLFQLKTTNPKASAVDEINC